MERNNRRHKRYELEGVQGTLAYNLDAKVLNVSLTGMAIETRTMLKVGGNYHLKIAREGEPLRVKADVRWCHLVRTERLENGEVTPLYKAGIDFRSILDDKARQMLQFIEENIVVELDQRLFGRFHLAGDSSVDLDTDEEFTVRKISLSGMLIETGFTPRADQEFEIEIRPNGEPIEARIRVANVRQVSGEESRTEAGVEFLELGDVDRRRLEKVIERLLE